MKKLLLLLCALIFAAPAWAADTAGAASAVPSASTMPEKATQPDTAKKTKKTKKKTASKKKAESAATESVAPMGCPAGCSSMHCPPPSGPVMCCKITNFTPC